MAPIGRRRSRRSEVGSFHSLPTRRDMIHSHGLDDPGAPESITTVTGGAESCQGRNVRGVVTRATRQSDTLCVTTHTLRVTTYKIILPGRFGLFPASYFIRFAGKQHRHPVCEKPTECLSLVLKLGRPVPLLSSPGYRARRQRNPCPRPNRPARGGWRAVPSPLQTRPFQRRSRHQLRSPNRSEEHTSELQ